jgi:hypothetical protein
MNWIKKHRKLSVVLGLVLFIAAEFAAGFPVAGWLTKTKHYMSENWEASIAPNEDGGKTLTARNSSGTVYVTASTEQHGKLQQVCRVTSAVMVCTNDSFLFQADIEHYLSSGRTSFKRSEWDILVQSALQNVGETLNE